MFDFVLRSGSARYDGVSDGFYKRTVPLIKQGSPTTRFIRPRHRIFSPLCRSSARSGHFPRIDAALCGLKRISRGSTQCVDELSAWRGAAAGRPILARQRHYIFAVPGSIFCILISSVTSGEQGSIAFSLSYVFSERHSWELRDTGWQLIIISARFDNDVMFFIYSVLPLSLRILVIRWRNFVWNYQTQFEIVITYIEIVTRD